MIIGVNCSSNLIAVGGNFSQASKVVDFPMHEPLREASDKRRALPRARVTPRTGSLALDGRKSVPLTKAGFSPGLSARHDSFFLFFCHFSRKFNPSIFIFGECSSFSRPSCYRKWPPRRVFSGVSSEKLKKDPGCRVTRSERWISLRRGSEVSPTARQRIVLGIKVFGLESNFLSFRRDFIRPVFPYSRLREMFSKHVYSSEDLSGGIILMARL